ncbi:hypothetical protein GFY24_36635 [Nocardia sp. SYP-A9097]|uniref:DUF6301 family protein n=1 Tax=Nocardia sp. SYP-A9097 TaxID=2663237 RepID=UPI00129A952D|nr:DUF6301 family protein [Nocardia sp. SYP-A9097]MRH92885.1 hypothetical protein [Nocardia sp. SYP-A9097]
MKRLLLTLTGRLDELQLDELRKAIGLNATGTVTDPVGTVLGTRSEGDPALPTAKLTLWRGDTNEWLLAVDESPVNPPYPASPAAWRGLAALGIRAAGLSISDRQEIISGSQEVPDTGTSQEFSDHVPSDATDRGWPRLGYTEVMVLATRLVGLDPSWRSEPGLVAETFGWPIREPAPGLFQLDTGPGTAQGYLYWRDGRAEGLEIPISMPIPDDDELQLTYAFTLLSTTLDEALGRSTEAPSTHPRENAWANDDLRLTLLRTSTDIRLLVIPKR